MIMLGLLGLSTQAQQKTVTGTVADPNGMPLPGVNVIVKNAANRGAQTDFDGKFSVMAEPEEILTFTYVGFKAQDVKVGLNSTINVNLEEDTQALDEVIVVAYGTTTRGEVTGSLSTVDGAAIENRPLTNVISALEGTASGVQIAPSSGQPGSAPDIRIRGFGSVNTSQDPLYVVDGVVYSGSFASLNANDIESFTILKDAASTAIYGSQGANGVVVITTKKGKKGPAQVNIEVSQGLASRAIPEYERVGPSQYYELMWEAYRNSLVYSNSDPLSIQDANAQASANIYGLLGYNPFNVPNDQIVGTNGSINPNASLLYGEDLDWEKALSRTGIVQNVNLSYQGATDKTDYFASISYLDQSANVINSDFERITARINLNSKVKDWAKTGLNLTGATSTSNQAVNGATSSNSFVNPFRFSRVIGPIYPVFLHDPTTGELVLDDAGNRIYDTGDINEIRPAGGSPGRHAIQENLLNVDKDDRFAINARAYAEFYFLNGFTFTFNAGLDKNFFNNEGFDNKIVGDGAPDGRAERTASNTTVVTYNQLLNYNKSFGLHNFSALLGHESLDYKLNFLTGFRQNQVVDGNTELINFATTVDLESYSREYGKEGYFSRLNYNYDNRYFIAGSYRRDGSSRFESDVRWGDFYSVSGAWRIDQEKFFEDIVWINFLKVRGSYGQVGNDSNLSNASLSFYASQSLLGLGNNNAAEPGILISAPGNPFLEWETQKQTDIGFDFGLFNNRISGSFAYYKKVTDGLIFDVPLPVSSGLDDYPANIGNMFNRGLELDLNLGIIRNENWTWDVNLNAATIYNEFTELPQEDIINGSKKYVVGGSIFDYWLRDYYGVDPADGSALYVLDTELGADGDADVRSINGNLVTTNQNKALYDFAGTALPDVYGSITNVLRYKGIELRTLLTYSLGGKTYDTNQAALLHTGDYGTALGTRILDRWQNPGDITDIPRLDTDQRAAFEAGSDRYLVSSSYAGLRQVSLSYTFPSNAIDRFGLSNAKVYLNGENLHFWTAMQGLDVGQNFNGTTQNRFTPARILSLGFNLTF
ncbi:TonB-linked outer membrane protein, SusC/RagA family [Leeuwenhoekiella marinoflava DSM 3653]|uniref:TonB-linked SusC/RagA family outer membrane protein n=3 Tax=Leeuwenhoekiella marinoflava TaxID=988 RepID=A0A4Q0P997_9FLAO|nr:TonB-linked SusC/RagA family outer membrane protein [Leeuwenhoekiella marinoflava]SHF32037.1 TonB-linked outer membrane protein, SusC/RagA family [Leeuwenhoekiella marinoflava DSM 3653]